MEKKYNYESFNAEKGNFDREFTEYLNQKRVDHWKVKDCTYCHDTEHDRMWASCIFKRHE
jgi:hypothetical protein